MSKPRIHMLEALGDELRRATEAARKPPSRARFFRPSKRGRIVACLTVAALGAAYAVPATRAAMDDLTASFARWVSGDDTSVPGRSLHPGDNAPSWVREARSRVIAEAEGVQLFALRTSDGLEFSLGNGVAIADTFAGWRRRFDERQLVVLGPAPVQGRSRDARGRFPLLGLTSRSVERVELRYGMGDPSVLNGVAGGFVIMVDAERAPKDVVAFDGSGRVVDTAPIGHIRAPQAIEP